MGNEKKMRAIPHYQSQELRIFESFMMLLSSILIVGYCLYPLR